MEEQQILYEKRLIEETFPVQEVSLESAREKSIRHGHISTLHIWWARRPCSSSRATNYASLVAASTSDDGLRNQKHFVAELSKWVNSDNVAILQRAKSEIAIAYRGIRPRILDPFAGGGAIPLEALRLGCETYLGDYNPVAVLILKCSLEYPQKYGETVNELKNEFGTKSSNKLQMDVANWGKRILNEVKKELQQFYPKEADGGTAVAYLWARTVKCQNPSCNSVIPMVRQYWLSVGKKKKIALYPYVEDREVNFRVVGTGYEEFPKDFDPYKGTIEKAITSCLVCGSVIDPVTLRKLFVTGQGKQRMIAVVVDTATGRKYRISTGKDLQVFENAEKYLRHKGESLDWGIEPVPDEPIHTPDDKEYRPGGLLYNFTPVVLYGMTRWGDLFNSRQKLTLITFSQAVRNSFQVMVKEAYEREYAKAVVSYLALGVDRLADFGSTLCLLNPTGGRGVVHTFGRQALSMTWDYAESNPFNPAGAGWITACEKNEDWIKHASKIPNQPVKILHSSATKLEYQDGFFDAVFTDPPYYDNVPYADLSDFFYVWLKRNIGDYFPDLFSTPLTPKSKEAIAELPLLRGMGKNEARNIVKSVKTGKDYEQMLHEAFKEIYRVLKPNGISVIVYAHKSTTGWETLINSLLDSGLVVTAAWPIHTEKKGRLRSQESAALASSIYMVTRKLQKEPTGFYKEIRQELRNYLKAKLDRIWNEGISGADFFISAIGSSIAVFGKYQKIIDDEGNTVEVNRLLEEVRRIVTNYAVKQVLHNGFSDEINPMTRLYVLWRWAYGDAVVDFDDAMKLGQSVGVDISQEWDKGFIHKQKEFVDIVGPDQREIDELRNSKELIDVLHYSLLLWKQGKNEDMLIALRASGFGKNDVFYRVAQAISESLPTESKEKKLLDGFLSGRQRIADNMRKETGQTRLFEK